MNESTVQIIYKNIQVVDNEATGKLLKKERQNHDITLSQIATLMDLSITSVSNLENGKKDITPYLVRMYMKAIDKCLENRSTT